MPLLIASPVRLRLAAIASLLTVLTACAELPSRISRHSDGGFVREPWPTDFRWPSPIRKPAQFKPRPAQVGPLEPVDTPADPSRWQIEQIVVKFHEGSSVRHNGAELYFDNEALDQPEFGRLARANLNKTQVTADLQALNAFLSNYKNAFVVRTMGNVSVERNNADRRQAESFWGAEIHDPNLFLSLILPRIKPVEAQKALDFVRSLASVDIAYFQPIPRPAGDIAPPTTLNLAAQQNWIGPGNPVGVPRGVDALFARRFPGGRGEDIRVVDVEAGWRLDHEDLQAMTVFFGAGIHWPTTAALDHGTAVIGMLAADEDAIGITGMVPRSQIGWSSIIWLAAVPPVYGAPAAIRNAAIHMQSGDVMLIEVHLPSAIGIGCTSERTQPGCGCDSQFGYVPIENYPADHVALSLATAGGIIVVEAAGNGQMTVNRGDRWDTGAIMVGASNAGDLMAACFSNAGSRVDVHAWGAGVATLGGGDGVSFLMTNGPDPRQMYTLSFNGTSSASPMVAGAAALVQSTRRASGRPLLGPLRMRELLVSTGIPQTGNLGRPVGPQVNVRNALLTYLTPRDAASLSATHAATVAPGAQLTVTWVAQNLGQADWSGTHFVRTSGATPAFTPVNFAVGSTATPITPGGSVNRQLSVTAPMQPGVYALQFELVAGARVLASTQQTWVQVGNPAANPTTGGTITIDRVESDSGGSSSTRRTYTVSASLRNTGNTPWVPGTVGLRATASGGTVSQTFTALNSPVPAGQSQAVTLYVDCGSSGAFAPAANLNLQLANGANPLGAAVNQVLSCGGSPTEVP